MADNTATTKLVQRTLTGEKTKETKCKCGKVCKNLRGLRIHQAKARCQPEEIQQQRTGRRPDETQEVPSQESHHSAEDLSADVSSQRDTPNSLGGEASQGAQVDNDHTERRERVKWPKIVDRSRWKQLDEDLDSILEATLQGGVEKKIKSLTMIVYKVSCERFGVEGEKAEVVHQPNRRQQEVAKLRKELKVLRRLFREANEQEKFGLQQLRSDIRGKLTTLQKAERSRKRRRETTRKRAAFIANPYKFTTSLLGGERSGKLETSEQEIEQHLEETHCDAERNNPLGECDRIPSEEEPTIPLDEKEPTWKEVVEVVKKARSGSAPGPSGIPYKVYKMCPKLLRRLWRLLKVIWRKGKIPECWQTAEGIFVPKEKNSASLNQFRTISLLSVEGKIFFAILARRMTTYMTSNEYIDSSVQKGGIPGFPGCIEHTSAITQLIREAKINYGDLTVVWLDLANAYGSVPHQLIFKALEHYHIPEHIQTIVRSYFSNIRLRFTVGEITTSWQALEKGIVTGCTISVILFVMGMNLIIKAADRETRGPKTSSGVRLPPNRGFMDDLTITTTTHVQARWIISALEATVGWARMKFKPGKSRCLILKRGKVTRRFKLSIQQEEIPTIVDNPIKCLGKWFDASLNDSRNIKRLQTQVEEGLRKIDKTGLPGKFKSWIYQHGLLPRLTWPLTLYEVTTTTVEALERKINKYLRRWLGVPPSFTSVGLYSTTAKLQLPISSLVEEFKVAKARLVMTVRDSKDEKIRNAGIETRTGRKWSASSAVQEAESRLRHSDIVGTTCIGRQGLGTTQVQRWGTADTVSRRKMVQDNIRKMEEEIRKAKMVEMGAQGAWTRWETTERRLTWSDIWKLEPCRIQFLLRSVYDVLPTPTNLHRWGMTETPNCSLCDRPGNLAHVLSSCNTALTQGRYTWRHNKVLRELADTLEKERQKKRRCMKQQPYINFVRSGEAGSKVTAHQRGILDGAQNWEMRVDLGQRLAFPEVVQTNLRPDILLWSQQGKKMIMIELIVPWEERCQEAYERKREKYANLADDVRAKGWCVWVMPVEMGCRGFPAQSMWRMFAAVGIRGKDRRAAVQRLATTAEKSSSWLWWRREDKSWKPSIDGQ
ncbi:uncharacterized protein LOC117332324 [Pecten maximus]|uniref:uncharacterized protein LOC117332324 n=1 Tax=Pecten maximus TaxID=6579 RepID=UPI0014587FFE|nr:uncharacterized protein LOC117332324 [Pecten maximus]